MPPPRRNEQFLAALGPHPGDAAAGSLLGLEHEFRVLDGATRVDFRSLLHRLPVDGRRLDPGDANAYRLRNGLAVTCDDAEAEFASPPIEIVSGFAAKVQGWAATGRATLEGLVGEGLRLEGYSTHLSAAVPPPLGDAICALYARTFSVPVMLLLDRASSAGIYLRPRPGRLEVCGEFVDGARLRAVSAFVAGSVRATAHGIGGERSLLPPALFVRARPSAERFGLYVGRRAFGEDLYALGRGAMLTRYGGGTITAQEQLSLAWESCRAALADDASDDDLDLLARMVAGSEALGIEADEPADDARLAPPALMTSRVFGGVVDARIRAGYVLTPVVATWPLTVFRADGRGRNAYVAVPRDRLPSFMEGMEASRLDDVILGYLGEPPSGRRLNSAAQATAPGSSTKSPPACLSSRGNVTPGPFRRLCLMAKQARRVDWWGWLPGLRSRSRWRVRYPQCRGPARLPASSTK